MLTVLAIDDFVGNSDSFGWMWSNYYLYYHLWEKRFYLLTWDQNLAFGGMWWWGGWWMWGFPWWWMWMMSGWNLEFWTWMWWFDMINMEDFQWKEQDSNRPDFEWWMPTPPDFNWWGDMWFPWDMWDFPWWDWWFPWWGDWDKKWWFWMNGNNLLKTRLLANEKFKAMYDEIYAKIEEIALNSDFSENFFNEWTNAFSKFHSSKELVSETAYSQWVEKLKSYLENKKSS